MSKQSNNNNNICLASKRILVSVNYTEYNNAKNKPGILYHLIITFSVREQSFMATVNIKLYIFRVCLQSNDRFRMYFLSSPPNRLLIFPMDQVWANHRRLVSGWTNQSYKVRQVRVKSKLKVLSTLCDKTPFVNALSKLTSSVLFIGKLAI